ncbi:hypothetical protein C723_2441 [Christiangramia flava JLT2011]|uniref:Uncharacterized protein n=1 Tax=Christiangramia flava JLT2011 TaxID=1229726 RepID=A0A1L7I0F2_9FLAO|nr:hypothetical protein GRFL_0326 [Christiangramia flava JLT2011]OSS38723.1 hypothetical protein C723_2441 [Christiangramia flava JLT2011]
MILPNMAEKENQMLAKASEAFMEINGRARSIKARYNSQFRSYIKNPMMEAMASTITVSNAFSFFIRKGCK